MRSLRLRAAVAAGLMALLAFGLGALWQRHVVYNERMDAATTQAQSDVRTIQFRLEDPTAQVRHLNFLVYGSWVITQGDGCQVIQSQGELDPYLENGLCLPPAAQADSHQVVKVQLGTLPAEDRGRPGTYLQHHDVALVVGTAIGAHLPNSGLTIYVLASPKAALEALAALDRMLLFGLPLAVLFVAWIAWLVTGRALKPVEAIRAQLAHITAHDLSRRVPVPRTGDEISRLAKTTNATLDRLESAVARQQRFVADAAHELRSPLATLRNALEVTVAHPERADWPAVVSTALGETRRLQHLTEDLLLLARLDAAGPPAARSVDLGAVAAEQVAERGFARTGMSFELAAGEPAVVSGDEGQLGRLLRNLLDNAAQHATSAVTVAVHTDEPDEVVLEVADDGPGIAPTDRERVFERFTRLDSARARSSGGAGLGLAIVRDVAAQHGGSVCVADGCGGARFVVRLPRALSSVDH